MQKRRRKGAWFLLMFLAVGVGTSIPWTHRCEGPFAQAQAAAPLSVSLASVYDAAGPGEGYDKLLVLDPDVTYTGFLWIRLGAKCCVHGNGAVIDLQYTGIRVQDGGTVLDIDHCVLTNGQAGLIYVNGARGIIRNNTILHNDYGIDSAGGSTAMLIENNIIVDNAVYGIIWEEFVEPTVQYNTVWGNAEGSYMHRCG